MNVYHCQLSVGWLSFKTQAVLSKIKVGERASFGNNGESGWKPETQIFVEYVVIAKGKYSLTLSVQAARHCD